MRYIDDNQRGKCHAVIHTASVAAAGVGAGLAQIPGSDNAVLVPIQVTMVIGLGQVFGMEMTESAARATLATAAASMVGRTISQVVIGWLPGLGNTVNACTAAGITESIGWMLAEDFARQTAC